MAESIPADKQARQIQVVVEKTGKILRIWDKAATLKSWWEPSLPLDGTHYGWSLEKLRDTPLPRQPKYAGTVNVSANDKDDKSDVNTVALGATELIKLDVGYWGAYHRDTEKTGAPQRDFGMIDGLDVWLCRFSGKGPVAGTEALFTPGSLGRKFVDQLNANNFGLQVVKYARAQQGPSTDGIATDRLMFIFPDLHLPEKWPDRPTESSRHGNVAARDKLRERLRQCQSVGPLLENPLDKMDRKAIEDYLDNVSAGTAGNWEVVLLGVTSTTVPVPIPLLLPVPLPPPTAPLPVPMPTMTKIPFTPAQFMAEKAIVDRELIMESCWFYAPNAAKDHGDATPAVDLVNLLAEIQTFANGNKAEVVQVGDMFELWMNREFLYRGFKVASAAGSKVKLSAIKYSSLTRDKYQYRMDVKWQAATEPPHPVKRYPFHEWPEIELVRRHQVGSSGVISAPAQARAQDLLKERIQNVHELSLPLPTGARTPSGLIGGYSRTNVRGETEYKWNAMILDKFKALSTKRIWGNHDGYRGDPALNGGLGAPDDAKGWISQKGIWIEHSHRWDDYNRDGMAFGAGVTNMVYYYCARMLAANAYIDPFIASEQSSFQAGAAFWFLLVNFGQPGTWFPGPEPVLPFGIYANGHTHTADLVRAVFKLSLFQRMKDEAEALAEAAKKKAEEAAEAAKKAAKALDDKRKEMEEAAKKKAEDMKEQAKEELRKIAAAGDKKVSEAKQFVKDGVKTLKDLNPWK